MAMIDALVAKQDHAAGPVAAHKFIEPGIPSLGRVAKQQRARPVRIQHVAHVEIDFQGAKPAGAQAFAQIFEKRTDRTLKQDHQRRGCIAAAGAATGDWLFFQGKLDSADHREAGPADF